MKTNRAALGWCRAMGVLALFCIAVVSSHSSNIKCGEHCADYQHTDPLPDQPPQGMIRLAIGGDSRDDRSHVLPWAFQEARKRGATAFLYLGDMEITRRADKHFARQLPDLAGVPFYPVIGEP